MKNIILIGFMGSGKSTVGKELAKSMGMTFIDMDGRIEDDEGCKISEIFANKGEEHFRVLENKLIYRLSKETGQVVSTGGGIVTFNKNLKLLKKAGKVVFLRIKPETVLKRLEGDESRPLLMGDDKLTKITNLLLSRKAIYEKVADLTIDVDNLLVNEIVSRIVYKL